MKFLKTFSILLLFSFCCYAEETTTQQYEVPETTDLDEELSNRGLDEGITPTEQNEELAPTEANEELVKSKLNEEFGTTDQPEELVKSNLNEELGITERSEEYAVTEAEDEAGASTDSSQTSDGHFKGHILIEAKPMTLEHLAFLRELDETVPEDAMDFWSSPAKLEEAVPILVHPDLIKPVVDTFKSKNVAYR